MSCVRRQLADRLYDHEWEDGACKCGWVLPPGAALRIGQDHCDHVAAILVNDFNVNTWAGRVEQ